MKLTEDEIKKIALDTINELGKDAQFSEVKEAVRKKVESITSYEQKLKNGNATTGRVILTAFGLNKPGIIAAVTKALAESNCDILDLSQKIMGEFFTMIMIIDISNSQKDLKEIQNEMAKIADELRIKIYLQHEDIFRYMHRI